MEEYKKSYKKKKLQIPAPTRNDKFELANRSNSASDSQDYFEYITKKLKTLIIL